MLLRHRTRTAALVLAVLAGATACTGSDDGDRRADEGAPTSPSPTPTTAAPTEPVPTPTPSALPPPGTETSLASYFAEDHAYDGDGLTLGRVRERTDAYTSYDVGYDGSGLRISGVLNVPRGPGPFPAVVLAHGYIEPSAYTRGQGMTRERGYLAARGYVALHVDYRAHAASDGTVRDVERQVELGYVADVVNAASALRRTDLVPVDDDRISLMGRSMGGGVTYRALTAAPGVFDAGVAWASVSTLQGENFDRWSREEPDEVAYFRRAHGLPGTDRGAAFWAGVSARTHLGRIADPVLTVHGRQDSTCPPRWARATHRALVAAGAPASIAWYDGEGHTFGPRFAAAMDRSIAHFEAAGRD